MFETLSAFFRGWEWRPEIVFGLLVMGALFSLGWRRLYLRARSPGSRARRSSLTSPWRLISYWAGLIILALALLSPIDIYGSQLFIMHMVQHIMLVMIAPPLLLIANPLPFLFWGLPPGARRPVGSLLAGPSPVRRGLRAVTGPGFIWLLFVAIFIGWHDPKLYDAALRSEWVHDLEHLTFFLAAMLIWWHITAAGPRIHGRFSRGARAAYAISFVPPTMIAGIVIAFSRAPIYRYYTTVPRLWGIGVMQDQQWGGIIMWVPGSMMFIIAALILLARMFNRNDAQRRPGVEDWSNEKVMMAPGLKE